jgi:hypothetical protein
MIFYFINIILNVMCIYEAVYTKNGEGWLKKNGGYRERYPEQTKPKRVDDDPYQRGKRNEKKGGRRTPLRVPSPVHRGRLQRAAVFEGAVSKCGAF